MRKTTALLGSALFFLIAPFTFGFIVPWWIAGWHIGAPFLGNKLFPAAGLILVLLGLVPVVESFARFALKGLGTPAPIAPPSRLVVTGFYRYVRNPMYVGMILVILGQTLILGDARILALAVLFFLAATLYVTVYEEPVLRRKFGADYQAFCRNVPRWWPRLRPWSPTTRE